MLRERLEAELKAALKEHDAVKLTVIRQIKAGILVQETKGTRFTLGDDGIIQVIAREIKERREAVAEFERGHRPDLVDKAQAEIRVLQDFLPPALDPTALREAIERAIAETGAVTIKDMGKVMAVLMPIVRGRADGKTVSDLVQDRLAP